MGEVENRWQWLEVYVEIGRGNICWERSEMIRRLFDWGVLSEKGSGRRYRYGYIRRGEVSGGIRVWYQIVVGDDGDMERSWVEDRVSRMVSEGGKLDNLVVSYIHSGGPMERILGE